MSTQAGHSHEHPHHRANVTSKSGPARMASTQDAFRREISRRFSALREALRQTIIENDALHLAGDQTAESGNGRHPRELVNQPEVDPEESFPFETNPQRLAAFERWWESAIDRGLVEPLSQEAILNGEHFSATHVDAGYRRGVRWANARAREQGVITESGEEVAAIVRRPPHTQTLQTLYTRTFREVEYLGNESARRVNRILAEQVEAGENPRRIGTMLSKELSQVNRTAGRRVARTEVMNAFAQGNGKRLQEFDVEWANIATFDPCPRCEAYQADGPHPVEDVMAVLPLHPNCVCAMVPAAGPNDTSTGFAGG